MKAAKVNNVKRVVLTSSAGTIRETRDTNRTHFGPADWSDVELCGPYLKSKVLSEKAAWKYLEDLPVEERFELVTVLPGFILGPNYNTC